MSNESANKVAVSHEPLMEFASNAIGFFCFFLDLVFLHLHTGLLRIAVYSRPLFHSSSEALHTLDIYLYVFFLLFPMRLRHHSRFKIASVPIEHLGHFF